MRSFFISKSALQKIQNILRSSECSDPVVMLLEMAAPSSPFEKIKDLLLSGRSPNNLGQVEKSSLIGETESLTYSLHAATYDRKDCRPEDLVIINGLPFVMTPPLRNALDGYCLIYESDRFSLRSSEDLAYNLRSVKTIKWYDD